MAERDTWPGRVREVVTKLDRLLGELGATVDALNSIPLPPADGQSPAVAEVQAP